MPQQKSHKNPLQKEESVVTQLVTKYMMYWPVFVILFIVAITGAYMYLRYATPMYEASATLILKDEKKGAEDSKILESINSISTKKIIENEIEVLQSRTLMDNVVKNLHLYAPVMQEGKIRTVSAYRFSPLVVQAFNPDSIRDVPKVIFDYDQKAGTVSLNGKYAGSVNEWLNTPYGKLRFVPNKKYIPSSSGKPFFFSLKQVKDVTKIILLNLKVTASSKLSSIINLSCRDEVPEKAEEILNQLIIVYDRAAIDEKNSLAKTTLSFVDDRLNVVSKDLDSIEKNLQSYKSGANASDISAQSQMYLQNVSTNDQELGKLNMQIAVLDQVDNALASGGGSVMPSTLGIADPALSQMMTDLNTKELEYERLRKTVAENNPMLVSLRDQINKIKPSIADNLSSQRRNLEASRSNLSVTNSKYNSMLSTIPQKERALVEISRDQNIKNGIYNFLLQKREESQLSYASTLSDSRVVNKAQASKFPVSPNKIMIYLAALAVAFGICILFISARETFSSKVLYRFELENMTHVPIIGEVAFNKSKESVVIEAGKRSFIAEEFRKIRVSLHFLGIDSTHKKILVTSSIPGEGKSFVAANLGISNSLTGKKVVLVDIDLHNPGLGRIFDKTPEDAGVSDYLAGKKKIEDIIKKVPGHENLFFVSSGTLHESPSELLLNGKINDLVAYLETTFDLVVMDTAPVVLVTDAHILSKLSNATIYVVRHKYTPKMLVKRIDENFKINPLTNPGIVFNGVKMRGFFKNNYGYGYDYVYGGKYINDDNKKKDKKKKQTKV